MEAKLRKWEEELKQREANVNNTGTDQRRLEDYLQKTEARNLELEATVRTLQRRICLLEQSPYPLYRGNMKPESKQQTENPNCDSSHVNSSTNTSQRAQQSSKNPPSVMSTTVTSQKEELISGIHSQVTSYTLRKVSQQITRMGMMDAEVTTENTAAQDPYPHLNTGHMQFGMRNSGSPDQQVFAGHYIDPHSYISSANQMKGATSSVNSQTPFLTRGNPYADAVQIPHFQEEASVKRKVRVYDWMIYGNRKQLPLPKLKITPVEVILISQSLMYSLNIDGLTGRGTMVIS